MPKWFLVQGYEVDPNRLPHPDQGLPGPQPPFPPRPGGPVDPGYSPPWAQVPPGGQGGGPVDPGYSPPWAQIPVDPGYGMPIGGRPRPDHDLPLFPSHPIVVPPGGIWPDAPHPEHPIVIPPQFPDVPVDDPNHMHMVAYVPKSDGTGYERITFKVEIPPAGTVPEPKA
jgi:hypothetical protein